MEIQKNFKVYHIALETVFPVHEILAENKEKAIIKAQEFLLNRLQNNPSSLMFSAEQIECCG